MAIVILQGDVVVGYNTIITKAECMLPCVEVNEIPDLPSGAITRYIDGQFVTEPIPAAPPSEVEQLKSQLTRAEQANAENSETIQQLLETLIDLGVI
jgi:hypothetical protein